MKAARGIVTTIVIIALVVALAMPAQAGAKTKTRKPKLNKTKVTLVITEKKNEPAVRLKVKYARYGDCQKKRNSCYQSQNW